MVETSHKVFLEADSRLATQENPVFIRITMLITVLTTTLPWKPFRPDNSILFLSFRRVLNVIYSFLGNSPASEFRNVGN